VEKVLFFTAIVIFCVGIMVSGCSTSGPTGPTPILNMEDSGRAQAIQQELTDRNRFLDQRINNISNIVQRAEFYASQTGNDLEVLEEQLREYFSVIQSILTELEVYRKGTGNTKTEEYTDPADTLISDTANP
jgi:hypothetical protein